MKRLNDHGQELYEFDLTHAQLQIMGKRATRNRNRNSKMITEACRHVNGDPNQPLLKDEYLANAEKIRELNKLMGHDRDEVLARTMAAERHDEQKVVDRSPLIWKEGEKEKAPHVYGSSWFGRFMDWIDRIQYRPDHPVVSRRDYLNK